MNDSKSRSPKYSEGVNRMKFYTFGTRGNPAILLFPGTRVRVFYAGIPMFAAMTSSTRNCWCDTLSVGQRESGNTAI